MLDHAANFLRSRFTYNLLSIPLFFFPRQRNDRRAILCSNVVSERIFPRDKYNPSKNKLVSMKL